MDKVARRALYRALVRLAPSLGASVALAVIDAVDAEIDGPQAALRVLDAMTAIEQFQPGWAARAHLLASADESEAAEHAYRRAVDLTTDSGSSDI